jgi:RNA polymerase sigma-70 factor, ECF subfamily
MDMFIKKDESPIEWLEKYGDYLYAFAMSRLHNQEMAEDLVQETLLAALQSQQNFSRNSSEKTWLTAILKNKIIDHYRRSSRQVSFATEDEQADFFDREGSWHESPGKWTATPQNLLEQKEFQAILQESLANLPKNLSAVFILREIEGLDSKEICEILNLSPNNLWVMMHRARLLLRQSIETKWFGRKTEKFINAGEFGLTFKVQ